MDKYVNVEMFHNDNYTDGFSGINKGRIHDEVVKQFESGNTDNDGNPIAYLMINGVRIEVAYVIDRLKPWDSYYEAKSISHGIERMERQRNFHDIGFYYLTNTKTLI